MQTSLEKLVALLPGSMVFKLGECLGGIAWYLMPVRRRVVLRNLRVAFHGEYDIPTLKQMSRESFRRTGANLISAGRTTLLDRAEVEALLTVENPELLEESLTDGRGMILLPPHMGNWEILSRMHVLLPPGHKVGAFYRPLNNPLLNERLLAQRTADGAELFSKREGFHTVSQFLRAGGLVGILADQRVGRQGEVASFFNRLTRASPLPSLMARRSKCHVFSMSLKTVAPGKWRIKYHPLNGKVTTQSCMDAIEVAMRESPLDVFWFQERWRLYFDDVWNLEDWLGGADRRSGTRHRALLWLVGDQKFEKIPEGWTHGDFDYEVALAPGQAVPDSLPPGTVFHRITAEAGQGRLRRHLREIEMSQPLPVDFILSFRYSKTLRRAARREAIQLINVYPY